MLDIPPAFRDAPADYMERQLKGIVGFNTEALEGKLKPSQNRSEADRASVAAALSASPESQARDVGAMMDALSKPRPLTSP